jgi:hypothetical protein
LTNPTSNYGFVLPTSTDLVTDLPADFDVALQGVDTRLKALQPGTTLGDIAYSSATANTNTRLPIGTTGQVLAVSGGVPAWTTTADVTPLTTKGDLFTFDTADARLGVGTNGQTLVADSSTSTGLKWATASSGAVVQVKSMSTTTAASTTSSTFQDSNITLSITPTSASNKILVLATVNGILRAAVLSGVGLQIVRTSTAISIFEKNLMYTDSGGGTFVASSANAYLDSPATTSATTYKVQFRSVNNSNSVSVQQGNEQSTLILMEVTP